MLLKRSKIKQKEVGVCLQPPPQKVTNHSDYRQILLQSQISTVSGAFGVLLALAPPPAATGPRPGPGFVTAPLSPEVELLAVDHPLMCKTVMEGLRAQSVWFFC